MGCLDVFLDVLSDTGKGKRFATQSEMAEHCDVLPGQINKWINGKGLDNISKSFAIMDKLGCTLLPPNKSLDDFYLVPKVEAKCGAGASLETSGDIQAMHAFRKSFFGRCNIHARSAVMMDVIGDSMENTLFEGDTVLIDKSDNELRDGYIYVVTLGDELRIKRIQKELKCVKLLSDNPRYSPIIVEGIDLDALIVHGRVRWVGRSI